jgi:hypothetical protein
MLNLLALKRIVNSCSHILSDIQQGWESGTNDVFLCAAPHNLADTF